MTQDTIKENILALLRQSKLTKNGLLTKLQCTEQQIIYPLYTLLKTGKIKSTIRKHKETIFSIK